MWWGNPIWPNTSVNCCCCCCWCWDHDVDCRSHSPHVDNKRPSQVEIQQEGFLGLERKKNWTFRSSCFSVASIKENEKRGEWTQPGTNPPTVPGTNSRSKPPGTTPGERARQLGTAAFPPGVATTLHHAIYNALKPDGGSDLLLLFTPSL